MSDDELVDYDEGEEDTDDLKHQLSRLGTKSTSSEKKPNLNPLAPIFVPSSIPQPNSHDQPLNLQRDANNESSGVFATASSAGRGKRGWSRFTANTSQRIDPTPTSESQATKRQQMDTSPVPDKQENALQEVSKSNQDAALATTLVVSNIPPQMNTIVKLAGHFSQFGEVLNVRVDTVNSRAFVQFADTTGSKAAFTSPIPVLQNRFIRVERAKDVPSYFEENANPTITKEGLSKPAIGTSRNLTYRAPLSVIAPSSSTVIEGLYDMPETSVKPIKRIAKPLIVVPKAVQKAQLKVTLQEKTLELAKSKLANLTEKMKEIKDKLGEASKKGKSLDPAVKSSIMGEFATLSTEIKAAQEAILQAEAKLIEAKTELDQAQSSSNSSEDSGGLPSGHDDQAPTTSVAEVQQ